MSQRSYILVLAILFWNICHWLIQKRYTDAKDLASLGPILGEKNRNHPKRTFYDYKKTEKNLISPNFNPNNLELYTRVGTHFEHNHIKGQFLYSTVYWKNCYQIAPIIRCYMLLLKITKMQSL
jgi:hypothetical protein